MVPKSPFRDEVKLEEAQNLVDLFAVENNLKAMA